jgi:lipid II:glycine glycyltransferase (peptidoglycan interpeptide bridge formation enzyme)
MVSQISIDEYDHFVQSHPDANVFHSRKWITLISEQYNFPVRILALKMNNEIRSVIPFLEIKHRFSTKKLVSLPFSDYVDPLVIKNTEDLGILLNFVNKRLLYLYKHVEIRSLFYPLGEFIVRNAYVVHYMNLNMDFQSVYAHFSDSKKRNIRKAQRENVQIKRLDTLKAVDDFYMLHLKTRRKHGVPTQPKSFFKRIFHTFISSGDGFLMSAYLGKKIIGSAIFLTYNNRIMFKFGASDEKYLNYRPNDLLFFETIKYGCENGFIQLDFGTSSVGNEGLRRFKTAWGATEKYIPYTYFTRTGKIPKSKGGLSQILRDLIRISPLWLNRIIGLLFYNRAG